MRFVFVVLVLAAFHSIYANDVANYLQKYGETGVSNYSVEQDIIKKNNLENLIERLSPFYSDTLMRVRQKAYYLTYKKAVGTGANQKLAVNILLNGCNDKDGGIVGQNLEYLKVFKLEGFSEESVRLINSKLLNHRIQHYKDFVLLAGFIGVGKEILYQKVLDESVSAKTKWYASLALARMGNAEQIKSCMDKVRRLPVNDNLLEYVIPDLIYMRQKEGFDFCVEILNKNEKLCHSLNPDNPESLICGYRVLELLAPFVVDIPVALDATGLVSNGDYESILNKVRKWFVDNPNYQLRKNAF